MKILEKFWWHSRKKNPCGNPGNTQDAAPGEIWGNWGTSQEISCGSPRDIPGGAGILSGLITGETGFQVYLGALGTQEVSENFQKRYIQKVPETPCI